MHAFREFQAELERLHQQAERARRADKATAVARIKALIADYGIPPEALASAWQVAAPTPTVVVKYRDPATGATWSGRGRAPKWITGDDRTRFEVE